ncbi:MAG: PcfJ domain-containing protein [Vicingus serpentipes]|nr:PcfJ domain-containing protein [Vicingus serpentipes]
MKKEIVLKKIELFKKAFPKFKESASGNLYAVITHTTIRRSFKYNGYNVTKGTLEKLGTKHEWQEHSNFVFIISKTGKMSVKFSTGFKFRNLTIECLIKLINNFAFKMILDLERITKEEYSAFIKCAFIGKKAEWLMYYPDLWNIKFFQGFKSLKEAKLFLGYDFISDSDFLDLFKEEHSPTGLKSIAGTKDVMESLLYGSRSKDERVNVINIIKKGRQSLLKDYIKMSKDLGVEYYIPKGINQLKEQHDAVVSMLAIKNAASFSDTPVYYFSEVFSMWSSLGLKYKVLDSARALHIQGTIQHHCLSSYGDYIQNYLFVAFEWEDMDYDCQISPRGQLLQIHGKYNCDTPVQLRSKIEEGLNNVLNRYKERDEEYTSRFNVYRRGKSITPNQEVDNIIIIKKELNEDENVSYYTKHRNNNSGDSESEFIQKEQDSRIGKAIAIL